MSFKISIHDDVSISELITIHNNGGIVLKTPHVGNIYPNNLAIAALGIPILFYDRTIGTKDVNFHPDKLIIGGKSYSIADPEILTTYSSITKLPEKAVSDICLGMKLVDFHTSVFKRALPKANCFTYTEYIQSNKDKVTQLLEIITSLHPQLWTRTVDEKGIVSKSKAGNWDDITRSGIYGLTNQHSGWIIPNPVSILFHGTIDLSKTNVQDVYLLSGPDMYRYIGGYQEELDESYNFLREKLDWHLPLTVNCHIIPVISMRFIVEIDHKDKLDKLLDMYVKYLQVEDKDQVKNEILNIISQSLEVFHKTMFYEIEDAKCFTQHDLINSNGLYIHPWAVRSKLCDVAKAFEFLRDCYLLVKDQL